VMFATLQILKKHDYGPAAPVQHTLAQHTLGAKSEVYTVALCKKNRIK